MKKGPVKRKEQEKKIKFQEPTERKENLKKQKLEEKEEETEFKEEETVEEKVVTSSQPALWIIAGCYERVVLGYQIEETKDGSKPKITPQFVSGGHEGYIKVGKYSRHFLIISSHSQRLKV
jgi:hypothetical protein